MNRLLSLLYLSKQDPFLKEQLFLLMLFYYHYYCTQEILKAWMVSLLKKKKKRSPHFCMLIQLLIGCLSKPAPLPFICEIIDPDQRQEA